MPSTNPFLAALEKYQCSADTDPSVWANYDRLCTKFGVKDELPLHVLDNGTTFLALRLTPDSEDRYEDHVSQLTVASTVRQADYEAILKDIPPHFSFSHGALLFADGLTINDHTFSFDSPIIVLDDLDDMLSHVGQKNRWRVRKTLKDFANATVSHESHFTKEDLIWSLDQCRLKWEGNDLLFGIRQPIFAYCLYQKYPELFSVQRVFIDGDLVSHATTIMRQGMPRFLTFCSKPDIPNVGTYSVTRLAQHLHSLGHTRFDPNVHVFVESLENPYHLYKKILATESLIRPMYGVVSSSVDEVEWDPPYLHKGTWILNNGD